MLFCLIGAAILGGIIGVAFSDGTFFCGLGGQIVHGVFSIACFTLVGVASWRFGWKIGLLVLLLLFIASNVGLSLHKYLRKARFR